MLNIAKACFALRGGLVHNASPMGKGNTPHSGRSLRLLAACVLLLAACSGSDATATSTTTSTTVAATTTTTTTTSTTTSTTSTTIATTTSTVPNDEAPPQVDLTAETFGDLDRWWVGANEFVEWLEAHPTDDLGVLSMLYHPDGPEIQQQAELYRDYIKDDVRLLNANLGEALTVGCCPDPQAFMDEGDIRLIVLTTHPEPAQYVDSDGAVLEEISGWTRFTWRAQLTEVDDGRWLIWDLGGWEE